MFFSFFTEDPILSIHIQIFFHFPRETYKLSFQIKSFYFTGPLKNYSQILLVEKRTYMYVRLLTTIYKFMQRTSLIRVSDPVYTYKIVKTSGGSRACKVGGGGAL